MVYLPYVRCCVSLKWAHTANYSEFTQWEVPLLGSASTLVYIWIWQWNIHSRAQACVHAHCRHVNMDTCGGSHLKKNSGSFAKASLRIPLQQFVFFFFFPYSMHAPCTLSSTVPISRPMLFHHYCRGHWCHFFCCRSCQNVDSLSLLSVLHNISKWGSGDLQPSFQRT